MQASARPRLGMGVRRIPHTLFKGWGLHPRQLVYVTIVGDMQPIFLKTTLRSLEVNLISKWTQYLEEGK